MRIRHETNSEGFLKINQLFGLSKRRLYSAMAISIVFSILIGLYRPAPVEAAVQIAEVGSTTVTSDSYSTINLSNTYTDLIVVASARYTHTSGVSNNPVPRSPRIIKGTNSFQVKVHNDAGSIGAAETTTVDWVAMEAGSHDIQNGAGTTRAIAGSVTTSNISCNGGSNWNSGPTVTFSPAFSGSPSVIHTVTSDNDTQWVASHVNGGTNRQSEPTTTTMQLSLLSLIHI